MKLARKVAVKAQKWQKRRTLAATNGAVNKCICRQLSMAVRVC